jgi:hypothetical protein
VCHRTAIIRLKPSISSLKPLLKWRVQLVLASHGLKTVIATPKIRKSYFLIIKPTFRLPPSLSNNRFRLWFASLSQSNLIRYARRSALERINNRIDNSFGFEKHFIRGQAKMKTRMGLALAVMMAMALGHVKAGRIEQMRSLVHPIRQTG